MAAPIALRDDYDGAALRRLARSSDDANQTRRLLALAVICDGGLRGAAAEVGGVGPQAIRDWVLRLNARGPEGLIDVKHPGPKLNAEQHSALVRLVEAGPRPAVDGVVRWRLKDLVLYFCLFRSGCAAFLRDDSSGKSDLFETLHASLFIPSSCQSGILGPSSTTRARSQCEKLLYPLHGGIRELPLSLM